MEKDEMYPGKIIHSASPSIMWIGVAYDHLYCILYDGRTFRLDRINNERKWIEVAKLPL